MSLSIKYITIALYWAAKQQHLVAGGIRVLVATRTHMVQLEGFDCSSVWDQTAQLPETPPTSLAVFWPPSFFPIIKDSARPYKNHTELHKQPAVEVCRALQQAAGELRAQVSAVFVFSKPLKV